MRANTYYLLVIALCLEIALAACGGSTNSAATSSDPPLDPDNVNLIFVVSDDLAYSGAGDINPDTGNLTNQGLQRSLAMARFLRLQVLGKKNVTGVYALEPMTHVQTRSDYPDIAAVETIQQFALLNQITLSSAPPPQFVPYTGNSYPINASYAPGSVPAGVATPAAYCGNCQGLDFKDSNGNNETLLMDIIGAEVPGFYVFSAPWETVSALLANINQLESYNLNVPTSYAGPNYIYAIALAPSGSASLITFNSRVNPRAGYPVLPAPKPRSTPCTAQAPFVVSVTAASPGATIPANTNTNETLHIVRHADAHPLDFWSDGNIICAGQWRALDLPNALRGKISPDAVYSIDPAQTSPGTEGFSWSSIAPASTVEPYAIANNLPYGLAASFPVTEAQPASNFFFTGGGFSNQTVLLGYAYAQIPPMVNALIASYFPSGGQPTAPDWPSDDYDTIWTVTLDGTGDLTVDNAKCEGIDSASLPATCPQF
jgi:hypothetical protein